MMKTSIAAALLAFVCVTSASAQDTSNAGVVGKLITPDGKTVKNYPVIVTGKGQGGSQQNWISATDSNGGFSVKDLPPGQYTFAPANEPSATKSFAIEGAAGVKDLGSIQIAPGAKF